MLDPRFSSPRIRHLPEVRVSSTGGERGAANESGANARVSLRPELNTQSPSERLSARRGSGLPLRRRRPPAPPRARPTRSPFYVVIVLDKRSLGGPAGILALD